MASHECLKDKSEEPSLKAKFLGQTLQNVETPAAVLDRAIVKQNCSRMLEACRAFGVGFRPHVKTHKTVAITELQIGEEAEVVNLVVSTVREAEYLLPFLLRCKEQSKLVNVLYGIPLPGSQIARLARIGRKLGPGSISVLVDHPAQLTALKVFKEAAGFPAGVFIKIDTGYHRAGIIAESKVLDELVNVILEKFEPQGIAKLVGFYSHAGHSYGGNSQIDALMLVLEEIKGLIKAADRVTRGRQCVLSIGATPTATSTQAILGGPDGVEPAVFDLTSKLQGLIADTQKNYAVELHAGCYVSLDMQQLATQASPSASVNPSSHMPSALSTADIALTILAEVISVYDRDPPEALIAAGTLVLGREPCKSYKGWGVVSDWGMHTCNKADRSGWEIGRISQEHGMLTRDPVVGGTASELSVGQKIRIWPNHACIAGAGVDYYLVVDSSLSPDRQGQIVDVWERCRGW